VCHPRCVCVCENWKGYVVNTTLSIKMFNDYIRQLHVSAPTGIFRLSLRELKVLLYNVRSHYIVGP